MNETGTSNTFGQLIEPEPIGYSFSTPGWYLILGLFILTALVIAVLKYRIYRKNAYRREALTELQEILENNSKNLAFEINRLLKILAIKVFGRQMVASLYGRVWFNFLTSTMNVKQDFSVENIADAIYNDENELEEKDKQRLVEFATAWIKKHDVKNV